MAFLIDIALVPFRQSTQRWGDVTTRVLDTQPHPLLAPFRQSTQRWGDVTPRAIPEAAILSGTIPFGQQTQRWGDVSPAGQLVGAIADYYDPSTEPFVVVSDLDPAPGDLVPLSHQVFLPCGDRIATDEDNQIGLVDLLLEGAQVPELQGLDPDLTIITAQVTTGGVPGPVVTILAGGVVTPGWTVAVGLNDQAGPDRGIYGVGRNYLITPPGGVWEASSTVTIGVELGDYGRHIQSYSYSFDTDSGLLRLDWITPAVSEQGGDDLLCLGMFPIGEALAVTLGDEPCYGGRGYGRSAWSSNGTELRCYAPPLPPGSYTFSVTARGTVTKTIGPVLVVDRPWRPKEFSSRACYPPWVTVGKRNADGER